MSRHRTRGIALIGAALLVAGPLALGASGAAAYSAGGQVDQDVDWSVSWSCTNKAATVSAQGVRQVGLGRLMAHFRGPNGTTAQRPIDATIRVDVRGGYASPKSPNDMGAGGNPYIWFQPNGSRDSILLGRCNEASSKTLLKRFTTRNRMALASLASVGATGCSNQGGPDITVAKKDRGAMRGSIYFTNQTVSDPAHSTPGKEVSGQFDLNMTDSVSKGGANGGVTGNPFVKFAFGVDLDGDNAFGAVDPARFGVSGEYYTADGTWTADLNAAYGPERRCSELGR